MEHISYGHINLNGKYSFKLFFSANNSTIQCLVKGMKKIKTSANNVLRLYRNDNVMTLACISNSDDVYLQKMSGLHTLKGSYHLI